MSTEVFGAVSQGELERLAWRTATQSGGGGCVELAPDVRAVWVRDSKNPEGGQQGYNKLAIDVIVTMVTRTAGRSNPLWYVGVY